MGHIEKKVSQSFLGFGTSNMKMVEDAKTTSVVKWRE
jgi:hypothetical protein